MCNNNILKDIRICNSILRKKQLAGFLINYSFAVSLIVLQLIVRISVILDIIIRSSLNISLAPKFYNRILQVLYNSKPLYSSEYCRGADLSQKKTLQERYQEPKQQSSKQNAYEELKQQQKKRTKACTRKSRNRCRTVKLATNVYNY